MSGDGFDRGTDRLITAPLDLDQFQHGGTHRALDLAVWSYWLEMGYPIEEVREAWTVINQKRDAEDTGHVVCRVESLSKPLSEADAAVDDTVVWCCDCRDYQYNQGVDLEEKRIAAWGVCHHIQAVREKYAPEE